jgi:hypothetical protein
MILDWEFEMRWALLMSLWAVWTAGRPDSQAPGTQGCYGLHHQDRVEVPSARVQVLEQELHPDFVGGSQGGRLHALFGV